MPVALGMGPSKSGSQSLGFRADGDAVVGVLVKLGARVITGSSAAVGDNVGALVGTSDVISVGSVVDASVIVQFRQVVRQLGEISG